MIAWNDELDDFLDIYASTSTADQHISLTTRRELERFFRTNKPLLVASVLLVGASLYRARTPTTVYPATLLRELIRDLDGRARPTPSTQMLARVQSTGLAGWAPFAEALTELGRALAAGVWPNATLAGLALAHLRRLRPRWETIESEARRALRSKPTRRKDPAHRRALAWYSLCERLLVSLAATERGEVRLLLDYLLGLLAYFETDSSRADPSPAACTILVLEVFSASSTFTALPPDVGPVESLPGSLRRGSSSSLRKQLQRARLRAAQRSESRIDDRTWEELILPALRASTGTASQRRSGL